MKAAMYAIIKKDFRIVATVDYFLLFLLFL